MRDVGVDHPDQGHADFLVVFQLLVELISSVVGRDDFDRQIGRDLGPTLGQHPAGEATVPDERDIGPADETRFVGEALIAVVGIEGPSESMLLAKPAEPRE